MYSIKLICKALKFPRSTYYKALICNPSNRQLEKQRFLVEIKKIWLDSKSRYGAPKIHKVLETRGESISLKRVQRYMKELQIRSIVVKKYKYQTSKAPIEGKPNLLNQDFGTTAINQKWCADITYIHTSKNGWTYLASVMDFHSKKIIGYSHNTSMTAELALQALKNACLNVKDPSGIILHSDLGTQYTSDLFEEYLSSNKILHSYSRKGNPYDNACIESFHSLLKKEEVHRKIYPDFKAAKMAIFEYIESWYNPKRIHSAINYRTPNEVHEAA